MPYKGQPFNFGNLFLHLKAGKRSDLEVCQGMIRIYSNGFRFVLLGGAKARTLESSKMTVGRKRWEVSPKNWISGDVTNFFDTPNKLGRDGKFS